MKIEYIQAAIAGVAVVGSILLGVMHPDAYGMASSGILGSAVGGYFGLSQAQPKSQTKRGPNG